MLPQPPGALVDQVRRAFAAVLPDVHRLPKILCLPPGRTDPTSPRATGMTTHEPDSSPILILSPNYSADSILLGEAALASGWGVKRLHRWQLPEALAEREVAVYGEQLLGAFVAENLGLTLVTPPIDWLPQLPAPYRKRWVRGATLAEARAWSDRAFIKPADDKSFPARVYDSGSESVGAALLADELPVLIAEPVTWEIEFRCFVCDRTVATLSPYRRDGDLAQAADGEWPATAAEIDAALTFSRELLGDPSVALPPALALDVGRIAGRGWAVVELNEAWASGRYGCDPTLVLPVLQRAVLKRESTPTAPGARSSRIGKDEAG